MSTRGGGHRRRLVVDGKTRIIVVAVVAVLAVAALAVGIGTGGGSSDTAVDVKAEGAKVLFFHTST